MISYCIHRDVCKSWRYYAKEYIDTIFSNCPICPYFEPKDNKPKYPTEYDDYEYDKYIIRRLH